MKILNFGYTFCFTPIRWDSSAQVLKVSTSRIRLRWIEIQLLLVLIYEIFLVYQAATVKAESYLDRLKIIYVAGLWIQMNCHQIGCIWMSDYVELINKLSEYKKEFKTRK